MKRIKKRAFEIVSKAEKGDRVSEIFDWLIMVLIALSVVLIVLESFRPLREQYSSLFRLFEIITVCVFSVEYVLRIWTADLLYPDAKHPRLKYILSFMAVVDLFAILPSFLPFIYVDLRFLRMIRLFRLFRVLRVLKLGRYLDAWLVILDVIRKSGPQLVMSVALCFFVILFSAIIMYEAEYPVQPEKYPNVMASLWWAISALTTIGYGDVYPVTAVGKFFASLISLVGIGIVAIPTGIITAGFSQTLRGGAEKRIEEMPEDELLSLHARVSKQLAEQGYTTTITTDRKKE